METRRNRRIKQCRTRRIIVVVASIGVLGLGVGLALPRSDAASVLLLAVAVPTLAIAGVRAAAPTPGRDRERPTLDWLRSTTAAVERVLRRTIQLEHLDAPTPYGPPVDADLDELATREREEVVSGAAR